MTVFWTAPGTTPSFTVKQLGDAGTHCPNAEPQAIAAVNAHVANNACEDRNELFMLLL
jgi:hypothetical protein